MSKPLGKDLYALVYNCCKSRFARSHIKIFSFISLVVCFNVIDGGTSVFCFFEMGVVVASFEVDLYLYNSFKSN